MLQLKRRFAVGLGLLSLALAGCTTAAPPDGTAGGTSTLATTSVTVAPTTASPTSSVTSSTVTSSNAVPSTGVVDPRIPESARSKSPDGATEFVTAFIKQSNLAYHTLNMSAIEGLYAPTCKACASIVSTVAEWKSKGYTYDGNFATPTVVSISAFPGDGTGKVFVRSLNAAAKVKDGQGSVVETVPAEDSQTSVFVSYAAGAWRVDEIKVAA